MTNTANMTICAPVNATLIHNLALMLTAYERYGTVGRSELVELLADELEVDESMICEYNEFCIENKYCEDYINPMCDFAEMELDHLTPVQAFELAYGNDRFYLSDDYYCYECGNLRSFSANKIIELITDNDDFCRWYVENYILDDYDEEDIDSIISEANSLIRQGY